MSKMHSKTNATKNSLLIMIAVGLIVTALHFAIVVVGLIGINQPPESIANPALVQQQTIKKAYDLLENQTIQIDNEN